MENGYISYDDLLERLKKDFGGKFSAGSHIPFVSGCCPLELYSTFVAEWTDNPSTLNVIDLRPLNDANIYKINPQVHREYLIKILVKYQDLLWSFSPKRGSASSLDICDNLFVQLIRLYDEQIGIQYHVPELAELLHGEYKYHIDMFQTISDIRTPLEPYIRRYFISYVKKLNNALKRCHDNYTPATAEFFTHCGGLYSHMANYVPESRGAHTKLFKRVCQAYLNVVS